MTSGARPRSPEHRARRTLLLLAVLAGILAMHGLAPGGMSVPGGRGRTSLGHLGGMSATGHHGEAVAAVSRGETSGPGEHGASATTAAAESAGGDACRHASGAGGGTTVHHADATCAAAGTATGYAPPALLPTPVPAAAPPPARPAPAGRTVEGRAPPDLAELQLLRI
ncbi:DUF6153 family protein [Streptomyces sp. NPDC006743]|uniref:DUF6153 family protein n=1 Tax=Streptomyces sp. NPDC006743 TaxID=3154480 RepID=UPI0034554BC9